MMNKVKKIIQTKPEVKFFTFAGIYVLVTLLIYNTFFWSKIISAIQFTRIHDIIFLTTYFLALFVLSFIALSILFVKYTSKVFAVILTVINSVCAYFMWAYGVPIDEGMIINAFNTDTKEATDLLNYKMILYIVFLGIIPSFIIIRTRIIYKTFLKEVLYRLIVSIIILAVAFLCVALQYRQVATFVRTTKHTFDYLLPRNYITSIQDIIENKLEKPQELVEIGKDISIQNNNQKVFVVFIVGETARRANYSLYGYSRETNPLLKKDGAIALKNVSSCGTSTNVSLPCMFSHLKREEFINNDQNYEFLPSMLARNGISVMYSDNNFGGCKETCNNTESINTVKKDIKEFCSTGECVDGILLHELESYIAKKKYGNQTIVILHQNGSHGPRYNKRYPKEFEKFKPVCDNNDVSKCSKEELINAYDNTILYGDYIIHETIETMKKLKIPSVVIYVSDHGESLGEGNIYLHGFPYILAPKEQKEIPMIVWMSDSFKETKGISNNCIGTKDAYSHDNIFHSVLGIFDVKTNLYKKELDIFAECK